jgi:hypothetical protein
MLNRIQNNISNHHTENQRPRRAVLLKSQGFEGLSQELFDLLQGGGVVHGGEVTWITPLGHGLDGAAQQLAAAGLR